MYDMIVIGGGPAGYTAALYAVRAGLSCAVIEKMSIGGQLTLTDIVDNYPGFNNGIDGVTLGMQMQSGAERFGAQSIYDEVSSLELDGDVKKVNCVYGEYEARCVVIATGANPRVLGLEGESALTGKGVHYCAHCDGRFYKGKRVAVIGGGNSAVGDALYLSRICENVTLVHRRDTLRASRIYDESLRLADNIEISYNSTADSFVLDDNGKIRALRLRNTQTDELSTLECDGVFVSIGRVPATDIVRGKLELDPAGYIVADESTRTSVKGVYAAGDVRTKALRQIVTAVADGAVAVHYAEEYITETYKQ